MDHLAHTHLILKPSAIQFQLLFLSDGASETELADLLREMEIMKSIGRHKNIINLLGCCTQSDGKFIFADFLRC